MTERKETKAKETSIYEALVAAQAAISAVGKDGTNSYDKYNYRTIDAVMDAVHGAFTEAGVVAIPTVLEREQTERPSRKGATLVHTILTVRYTIYAQDGSHVEATVHGEGMDVGDKSISKAMSSAYKYCMFQILAIPSQDMIDSETESPQIAKQPTPQPETEEDIQARAELLGDIVALAQAAGLTMAELTKLSHGPVSSLPIDRLRKCKTWLEGKVDGIVNLQEQLADAAQRAGVDLEELEEQAGEPIDGMTEDALRVLLRKMEERAGKELTAEVES